jgi:small nuclear ribonucleoprotein (snRNP)-like protein
VIKLLYKILLFLFTTQTLILSPIWVLSQSDSLLIQNDIIIIQLKNGDEIRGVLISEDEVNFTIISGKNNTTIIAKSKIDNFKILSSKEIKNQSEFFDEALNYSQNCFLPTAFITKKDDIYANSHYNGTYNLKYGLSDHFEINAGGVFINYYYAGICYSTELFEFIRFSTTAFTSFMWFGFDGNNTNQFGMGFIPRLSIGNENRNITIGFISGSINNLNNWAHGGYFGAQRRVNERWTIAGELTAINIDSYNYFYLGDVIFKFNRKENVNWNFGLAGIKFPGLNALFPNDIPFIPLPYFGYSRKF